MFVLIGWEWYLIIIYYIKCQFRTQLLDPKYIKLHYTCLTDFSNRYRVLFQKHEYVTSLFIYILSDNKFNYLEAPQGWPLFGFYLASSISVFHMLHKRHQQYRFGVWFGSASSTQVWDLWRVMAWSLLDEGKYMCTILHFPRFIF